MTSVPRGVPLPTQRPLRGGEFQSRSPRGRGVQIGRPVRLFGRSDTRAERAQPALIFFDLLAISLIGPSDTRTTILHPGSWAAGLSLPSGSAGSPSLTRSGVQGG